MLHLVVEEVSGEPVEIHAEGKWMLIQNVILKYNALF